MDASLLELVCCPETHQSLRFATTEELTRMTNLSSTTNLRSSTTTIPPDAALLREDGKVAYPIRDGIPLLIVEERITLA